MQNSDFSFANDVRAAAELRTPRTARLLLFWSLALLAVGLIWAHFAVLDEVKRGNGRVVPSRQIQVVQSLEGGLVSAILVHEGEIVRESQPLMRIDDTNFASQFGEVRERRAAMAARVLRLEAEVKGLKAPVFPTDLIQSTPKAVETERNLFDARMGKLSQDVDVLAQQEKRLTDTLELLNRELDLTRKLHAQKVIPEIEMLKLDRQATDMRGQLAETKSRLTNVRSAFRAQAEEDLAKSRGDLAVLEESIKSAQDKVRRAELRAPVYGIVNKLNVTTIGAVVQPGANLMDIVPLDDTLLVEGRIRPQDIAFIRPEQDAVVKITAYDPTVYGSLKGKVERISADAIEERAERATEKGETFYRVMVRTDKNHLGTTEKPLPIIPGMVATVEVLTGEKSVLDYLIRPARLLRDEALRER
jgi:adhesin transport system membrane fusion protein